MLSCCRSRGRNEDGLPVYQELPASGWIQEGAVMEGTRTAYATKSDFSRVLTAEMDRLYLLAFLLTADHALAEQSFTTVAENAFSAKPVFKGWVHSWLRREVAK